MKRIQQSRSNRDDGLVGAVRITNKSAPCYRFARGRAIRTGQTIQADTPVICKATKYAANGQGATLFILTNIESAWVRVGDLSYQP